MRISHTTASSLARSVEIDGLKLIEPLKSPRGPRRTYGHGWDIERLALTRFTTNGPSDETRDAVNVAT